MFRRPFRIRTELRNPLRKAGLLVQRHGVVDAVRDFGLLQLANEGISVFCERGVLGVGARVARGDFLQQDLLSVGGGSVEFCEKSVVILGVLLSDGEFLGQVA